MPRFDTPITTNDQSFDRVLKAGLPVAIVFWDGGALTESLEAAMRSVARDDAGRVLIARLNTRENPDAAARVAGPLPALVTYRDGEPVTRGHTITARDFRAHVDHLLGRGPRPADPTTPPAGRQTPSSGHGSAAAGHARPITVTDASFQRDVLQSDLPVLVDLWAPWCGPCHMIAPIVEHIARDYAGRLTVAKLNVDENPHTSGAYHVQGIPTLLIFRNGRVVDRIVGVAPERLLRGKIDVALRS